MKIAFLGQKGIPMKFGGVEKHVEELAVGLKKRGHQVFAYTRPWYTDPKLKEYKGVELISIKSINTKHLDAISHTFRASIHALRQNYDIIHYHGVGPALLAWIPKIFKPKAKVVVTFHCIDRQHMKWGWIARLALRMGEWAAINFADDTITVSKVLQLYCSKTYGASTVYVPNGADVPQLKTPKVITEKFGLKGDDYILFMSRLVKHKGAHYLIEAYNKLKTDKKLVIAGGSSFTDDYVKKIKELSKDNPNIIFTGNVEGGSDLWQELYSNAYIFVHPSEFEGLPFVVLEAMSFGRCVLVSDIHENLEILADRFGFSFEKSNVNDLKNKIQYLLDCPDLVKNIGEDARDHIKDVYSWQGIVDSIEVLYLNVLNESERARINREFKKV